MRDTDRKAVAVITGTVLDTGITLDGVDAETIIYALHEAGISLFEIPPEPPAPHSKAEG